MIFRLPVIFLDLNGALCFIGKLPVRLCHVAQNILIFCIVHPFFDHAVLRQDLFLQFCDSLGLIDSRQALQLEIFICHRLFVLYLYLQFICNPLHFHRSSLSSIFRFLIIILIKNFLAIEVMVILETTQRFKR